MNARARLGQTAASGIGNSLDDGTVSVHSSSSEESLREGDEAEREGSQDPSDLLLAQGFDTAHNVAPLTPDFRLNRRCACSCAPPFVVCAFLCACFCLCVCVFLFVCLLLACVFLCSSLHVSSCACV